MMTKGTLSFSQLNQFLFALSQSGLIEKFTRNGKIVYRATPKGLEFMKKQQQIIKLLKDNTQTTIINTCHDKLANKRKMFSVGKKSTD
jgi:DNA-binding PadR family transcriptional regulator